GAAERGRRDVVCRGGARRRREVAGQRRGAGGIGLAGLSQARTRRRARRASDGRRPPRRPREPPRSSPRPDRTSRPGRLRPRPVRLFVAALALAAVLLGVAGGSALLVERRIAALAPGGVTTRGLAYNALSGRLGLTDVSARDAGGREMFHAERVLATVS